MSPLVFATNNQNKVSEIRAVLRESFQIVSLKEAGINIDIPEPYDTLEENAVEKCRVIQALTGNDCFSEDTGLEVVALNGAPGVKSARYAGDKASSENNVDLLLTNMNELTERSARFRTVISLQLKERNYLFEGICGGIIIKGRKGTAGFGYDPVFIPDGADKTFAEMNMDEKNRYSHRKKAVAKLLEFLTKQNEQDKG
jgi:XTP/dITP diphosphohydrolase